MIESKLDEFHFTSALKALCMKVLENELGTGSILRIEVNDYETNVELDNQSSEAIAYVELSVEVNPDEEMLDNLIDHTEDYFRSILDGWHHPGSIDREKSAYSTPYGENKSALYFVFKMIPENVDLLIAHSKRSKIGWWDLPDED